MKNDLLSIPGVGPKIASRLERLGYTSAASLAGADPEELYLKDCIACGGALDRCALYVYRCAIYFASAKEPEPEKLKWFYWKDRKKD